MGATYAAGMTLPLRIHPVPGLGAEDTLVAADGSVWTGTEDGAVHRLDPATGQSREVGRTGGRPLGLEWLPDGRLLVCDARLGLLAMDTASGGIEVLCDRVGGAPLRFTNNAAVAADGTIWFTDSSRRWGISQWKSDLIEDTRSGRLLRRRPTGEVETVVDGLAFANGVALLPDESAVLVAETGLCRVGRVGLVDGEPVSRSRWLDLPGHPDNIATGSDGLVWVTVASPADRTLALLQRSPRLLRLAALRAPESLKPAPLRTARVVAANAVGRIVHDLEFDATHWHMATGVREHGGTVWLGSLVEPALASYRLP